MDDFKILLDELDTLSKAMRVNDDKTQAAAADGGMEDTGGDAGDAGDGGDGGDESGKGGEGDNDGDELFGKSFKLTDAEGNELEAYDGTAMVKALAGRIDAVGGNLMKGMSTLKGVVAAQNQMIGRQHELIKSLRADLDKISGQGRGRQAVVHLPAGGGDAAGNKPEPMGREAILAKALTLSSRGIFQPTDVARVESYLNRGAPLPTDLAAKIAAA